MGLRDILESACNILYFFSSLKKKKENGEEEREVAERKKKNAKSNRSLLGCLKDGWRRGGGERGKFYGIVSSEKPLVLGRGAGRLGRGMGCYAPLF